MAIFREHIQDLLNKGVIRPSRSNYASPAFLVPKPNGKICLIVNYQKLNSKIKFNCFPLPTIETAFQHFYGAKVFSVIDLHMAYHLIPLTARSRRCTAFITPFGVFEFFKLPMGIAVGSQVLSREINRIFADIQMRYVFSYADDILVYSQSVEHKQHLRTVFTRLQAAGFTVNENKVTLGATKLKFLGHVLSGQGISTDEKYVKSVRDFPKPKNLKQLRRFIGMAGFYSKFVPNNAQLLVL